MVDQDVRLYVHSFQKDHESILEYYKRFTAQCDVIDIHGGQAGYHLALYTAHLEELKDQLTKGVHSMTLDQMRATATKTHARSTRHLYSYDWQMKGDSRISRAN